MKRLTTSARWGHSLFRLGLLGALAIAAGACNEIDTTRKALPKGTLGDDIYGLFCDRVGATVLPEDLGGTSYQSVCHYDESGHYGTKVDESQLPDPGSEGAKARKLSLAKLDTMVRHRSELIRAVNAAFPDVEMKDPTQGSGAKVRLHDALMDFSQRLAPLYDTNPYLPKSDPLLPATTRALGRLFDALGGHEETKNDASAPALGALRQMAARKGYRPFNVALGAIRPALAYPELRKLAASSLKVLGPTGEASPALQQLLTVAKHELLTSKPVLASMAPLTVNAATAQPNRPRSNVEVASAMLLTENDAFTEFAGDPSRFIARRDSRGFVVPLGSTPGTPGTLPQPFADVDGDGFADVDGFGRFIDAGGSPVEIASPFTIPGEPSGNVDAFGRPLSGLYAYVDTSRTLLAAVARHLVPLLDASKYGEGEEHETIMDAMAGSYLLYGGREEAQWDYDAEVAGDPNPRRGAEEDCSGCVKYTRFRGEESPIADLAHAAGQVLADVDSDVLLLGVMDLVQNHEQEVARLIGAMLRIRAIAAEHDQKAQNGEEAYASLPYEVPVWDELADVLSRMAQRPGLFTKLLAATGDPASVTPHGSSQHEGQTMANFFRNRDFLTYDPYNPNGDASNTTVGGSSHDDPKTPVNRKAPLNGDNRSIMQRSFQVIHDANGAVLCNKDDAYVYAGEDPIFGADITWPVFGGGYYECELFRINSAATFYLDTLLPDGHPKKAVMPIDPNTFLSDLIGFANGLGLDINSLFESSSGITGMTLQPTPQAINRLLFWGANTDVYSNMPDFDAINSGGETDTFIDYLVIAASPSVCPLDGMGANRCDPSKKDDLYRVRDYGTMFTWERLGYYDYLQPMVKVFAEESCTDDLSACDTTDTSGEQIFVDLLDLLWRHWPGTEHGAECEKNGAASTNPRYCSEAGMNAYEPILADAFDGDLVPALQEFAAAAAQLSSVTIARGPSAGTQWTGAEVLEKMTRVLFDKTYASSVGMVDRSGNSSTTWTDGTPQPQLTVFTMFADALHGIDKGFDDACSCAGLSGTQLQQCQDDAGDCQDDAADRKAQWKRARSQLVDEFFAIDGTGTGAKFHNPATPKALLAITQVMREQLNANCPTRESGGGCQWAKKDLGKKVADVLSGPLFAGIMDVQEQVRANEDARRELEKLLSFILLSASEGDAFQSTLASFADIMQILVDDARFAPMFNAAASAASPEADKEGPGCATTTINALQALTGDEFDKYHVLDSILPALVTPMDGGTGKTPIEVFMDTIADVNRIDAEEESPLDVDDYRAVFQTMNGFMTDETRGLEQFYTIIHSRPRE